MANTPTQPDDLEAEVRGLFHANGDEWCSSCGQEIDSTVCHCGDEYKSHTYFDGHHFCPMGCVCGYAENPLKPTNVIGELVKQLRDSKAAVLEAMRKQRERQAELEGEVLGLEHGVEDIAKVNRDLERQLAEAKAERDAAINSMKEWRHAFEAWGYFGDPETARKALLDIIAAKDEHHDEHHAREATLEQELAKLKGTSK